VRTIAPQRYKLAIHLTSDRGNPGEDTNRADVDAVVRTVLAYLVQ
jgi:hypothetical protein